MSAKQIIRVVSYRLVDKNGIEILTRMRGGFDSSIKKDIVLEIAQQEDGWNPQFAPHTIKILSINHTSHEDQFEKDVSTYVVEVFSDIKDLNDLEIDPHYIRSCKAVRTMARDFVSF